MTIGEYFMGVIAASVITALISMLACDEKSTLSKALNTVCSLFLLCVIVSPLSSLIAFAKDRVNSDYSLPSYEISVSMENAIYSSLAETSEVQIESALRSHVADRAKIAEGDIEIRALVGVSEGSVKLDRVVIYLYSLAKWCDPRLILDAVGELTDAECLIVNGD